MKLEVGKWCRTKKGTIFKIIGGNVDMWEIDIDYSYLSKCENEDYNSYAYNKNNSLFEELVVKASYNIIDILECGDVIKLFMEDDIDEEDTNIFELIAINYNDNEIGVFNSDFQIEFFPIENLREILTHEQMKQKAYKVGE